MIEMNWDNLCLIMKAISDDLYVDVAGESMTIDGDISRKEFEAAFSALERNECFQHVA